jgi:DNA-binding LacI/PurR family transcriptional regulator
MSRRDQTTIGVLVAFTRGLYFGGVLRGIDQAARAAGARVIVIQTQVPWLDQGDRERVRRFFPFAWDHLDGYIVLTEAIDLAGIEAIIRAGKPVVTISAVYPELACTAVVPDNVGGTCSAVDHLVGHGHRRIGFVGSLEQQDLRERYAGYQQALRTHGIEPDPDLLYLAEHNGERGALQAARQIVADRRCTAVVVGTDLCALDVIETAQACGMHVPGDLAVIGFDDIYEAQHTDPALTSVRCRFDDLGATAAGLLLGQIAGQPARSEPSYVPATLVQRFSCGCLEPATVAITTGDQGLAAQDWELHLAERLAAQLLYPAVLPPTLQPSSVWPGVGRLVEGLRAAVEDRPPPTAPEIAASWQAAGERATTVEALNAVYLLLSHAAQVRLALGGDNQAAERVRLYLLGCHLELIRACRLSSVLRCRALEAVVQINYEIGRALNRPSIGTTRDLSWLRSSSVVRGCLARWGEPTGGEAWPALTVRGCYSTAETPRVALGSSWTTEAFPPPEFVRASTDLVAPGPTVLLPLRTSAGDWGVLATVRPAADQVAAADSRGGPEEWAALLTPVLEREDLLGSRSSARCCAKARSGTRWRQAASMMDFGTGTC